MSRGESEYRDKLQKAPLCAGACVLFLGQQIMIPARLLTTQIELLSAMEG